MSRKKKDKHHEEAEVERVIRPGDAAFEAEAGGGEGVVPADDGAAAKTGGGDDVESLRNQLLRVSADYQNYQKRMVREIEQSSRYAQESVVKSLLPVLDNFDHTLEKGKEFADIAAVLDGVRIVYDHLRSALVGQGVQRIAVSAGDAFDPSLHEAMLHEECKDVPENMIVRELMAGYTMNGRTLRPAKVSVAKAPAEN